MNALIQKCKDALDTKGVAGMQRFISEDLRNWQTIKLNIAVTGNSGSGKSSFVNSIRGMRYPGEGTARPGVVETTKECKGYKHPANQSFVVWDLPGVGTPEFPKENYLAKVKYDEYDFFIITSKDRFTENDMWLAAEVQKRGKKFYFVRTSINNDVTNDERDSGGKHDKNKLLQFMKSTLEQGLLGGGIRNPKVFLIDNYDTTKYDFGKLNNELLSSCDVLKKDAVALSLSNVTREVLNDKKNVLERRIPKVAVQIASSAEYEQKRVFQSEINFYLKQFNIDVLTLSENKKLLSITDYNIREFRLVVDGPEHGDGKTIKSPTALRADESIWMRLLDFFTFSKEKTLLYRFSVEALHSNLDLLHEQSKSFYNEQRVKALLSCATSK